MPGLFDRLQSEIDQREGSAGFSPADLLTLSPELRKLMQALTRKGALTAEALAKEIDMPAAALVPLMDGLIEKGFVAEVDVAGVAWYKAVLARRRGREVPFNIWEALQERTTDTPAGPSAARPDATDAPGTGGGG